jgi:hypothetical protein
MWLRAGGTLITANQRASSRSWRFMMQSGRTRPGLWCRQYGSSTWHCLFMPGKAWASFSQNGHVSIKSSLVKQGPSKSRLHQRTAPHLIETSEGLHWPVLTVLRWVTNGCCTSGIKGSAHRPRPQPHMTVRYYAPANVPRYAVPTTTSDLRSRP